MIRSSIAIALAALCLIGPAIVGPASADGTTPDSAGGRYLFEKQADGPDGGYLRLDTKTGDVSLCSQRVVGFACEAVPDDRAVLENEIARLRIDNAALKKDLMSRGLPLPAGIGPDGGSGPPGAQDSAAPNNQLSLRLPSDADIDRMVALVGRAWHRFVDAVERAQQQILNKT